MNRFLSKYLFAYILLFVSGFSYSADITMPTCEDAIWISGSIVKGDALRLKEAIRRHQEIYKTRCNSSQFVLKDQYSISLNSKGGDVDEAIEMGRLIKESELGVFVSIPSTCYSSCVFLLASGVARVAFGSIGIHRPYFGDMDEKITMIQIRQKREIMTTKIKRFLEEMDVNVSLAEDMIAIPPNEIKILSSDELKRYRLEGDDANYEEKQIAKEAKRWGLTSREYRIRDDKSNSVCKTIPITSTIPGETVSRKMIDSTCMWSILLNISREEVENRFKKLRDVCLQLVQPSKQLCMDRILREGR